jgi:trans-2,3-dihydro-3-hydroxyanthranilate isomerase
MAIEGEATELYVEVGGVPHPVTLQHPAGRVANVAMVEQPAEFGARLQDFGAVAAALSVDPMDILRTSLPVQIVNTGVNTLIVPIDALATVRDLLPVAPAVDELLRSVGASCLLVFTRDTLSPANDLHVRVFAPPLGISEDPATGSANGALAAYLVRHGEILARPIAKLRSEQGSEMGRPSVIEIQVDTSTTPPTVLIGGRVASSVEGSVFY